jgi:hypothetical protein
MSMNFKFSRGYGEFQAVQRIRMCCYSNTHSTHVLLEQHCTTEQSWPNV